MGSAPRRVTVLIDSLLGGGAERVAVEAALALDPARYIPHLLVTRHTGPLESRIAGTGLEYTVLDRNGAFGPRQLASARAVVRSTDLLHAHKFEGALWGAVIAKAARRPLVAHEHTFRGTASLRRKLGYRLVIAPSAARIVCVSDGVAAALRADGVAPDRLEVVLNGVPTAGFLDRDEARAALGLPADGAVVGMVARLRPEKRHELALRAAAELKGRDDDVVLAVVGDGPRRDELHGLAAELELGDAVAWLGEQQDAFRFVRAFDALLLCSAYEGMPLAALEALVAGVPVVSTAVGALPELLADGGGTTVAADPAAIADALRDAVVADARTNNGAADRYGVDRMARDLERVYDEVLARA